MTIAERIYHQVNALPEALALEVLDFVAFLRQKAEDTAAQNQVNAQDPVPDNVWDSDGDVWKQLARL